MAPRGPAPAKSLGAGPAAGPGRTTLETPHRSPPPKPNSEGAQPPRNTPQAPPSSLATLLAVSFLLRLFLQYRRVAPPPLDLPPPPSPPPSSSLPPGGAAPGGGSRGTLSSSTSLRPHARHNVSISMTPCRDTQRKVESMDAAANEITAEGKQTPTASRGRGPRMSAPRTRATPGGPPAAPASPPGTRTRRTRLRRRRRRRRSARGCGGGADAGGRGTRQRGSWGPRLRGGGPRGCTARSGSGKTPSPRGTALAEPVAGRVSA